MLNSTRRCLAQAPKGRGARAAVGSGYVNGWPSRWTKASSSSQSLIQKRTYYPSILPNMVSAGTPEFQAKAGAMDGLVSELEERIKVAQEGGGAKAQERMRGKGKKLPRER